MDWRNLVSGMTAGGLSTLILHPLDLIKIRLQTNVKCDYRSRSMFYTFRLMRELRSSYGHCVLYQGLSANLVGSMSSWGLYFMLYEWLKKSNLMESNYFMSSVIAGVMVQFITNPIWMAKTRLCVQTPNRVSNYSGLVDCLKRVYAAEGIRGLYRGLIPGLFGVTHGAIQFTAYEWIKKESRPMFGNHDIPFYLFTSSFSKIIAVSLTYPYQVVRSRVQLGQASIRSVILSFATKEGFRGAFKGLVPSILRVLPATCITFVTYETLKAAL